VTARYEGRHRGSTTGTSSIPRGFRSGFAMPTAAAAALVLTATGATVAESPLELDLTGADTAAAMRAKSQDRALEEAARAESRNQRSMKQAAAQARVDQAKQAARAQERAALAQQQAALAKQKAAAIKAAAEKAAKAKAEAERKARQAWVRPINGASFTSGYGYRWGRLHAGNDFAAPVGTPLVSMSTGTVVSAGYGGGYGNKVEIQYWDGTVSWYAHMDSISVNVGEKVSPGEIVGRSGNTGRSTGPHLHLEIHPDGGAAINPAGWMQSRGLLR
jgi:murein DD-endopeptidase MepM/ murein hydrolase activator NlpD